MRRSRRSPLAIVALATLAATPVVSDVVGYPVRVVTKQISSSGVDLTRAQIDGALASMQTLSNVLQSLIAELKTLLDEIGELESQEPVRKPGESDEDFAARQAKWQSSDNKVVDHIAVVSMKINQANRVLRPPRRRCSRTGGAAW